MRQVSVCASEQNVPFTQPLINKRERGEARAKSWQLSADAQIYNKSKKTKQTNTTEFWIEVFQPKALACTDSDLPYPFPCQPTH